GAWSSSAARLLHREHRSAAVPAPGEDAVLVAAGAFHAGRTDRHAGHRDPHHLRLLLEQTPDPVGRHVPLHRVPAHLCGMAAGHGARYAELSTHAVEIAVIVGLDRKAGGAQMLDPLLAA